MIYIFILSVINTYNDILQSKTLFFEIHTNSHDFHASKERPKNISSFLSGLTGEGEGTAYQDLFLFKYIHTKIQMQRSWRTLVDIC